MCRRRLGVSIDEIQKKKVKVALADRSKVLVCVFLSLSLSLSLFHRPPSSWWTAAIDFPIRVSMARAGVGVFLPGKKKKETRKEKKKTR